MQENEILPAIPRQKVKHIESGEVFNVIAPNPEDNDWIMVLTQDGYKDEVLAKNCQPVPEEPRPFRVGDKVVALDYAQNPQAYFKIQTLEKKDGKDYAHGSIFGYPLEHLRHATPSEVAQYFNQPN